MTAFHGAGPVLFGAGLKKDARPAPRICILCVLLAQAPTKKTGLRHFGLGLHQKQGGLRHFGRDLHPKHGNLHRILRNLHRILRDLRQTESDLCQDGVSRRNIRDAPAEKVQ